MPRVPPGVPVALVLLAVLSGCGVFSEPAVQDDAPAATTPAGPSAAEVAKWERNAEREQRPYLDAASAIAPGLAEPAVLAIGVDLCRHMFRTDTDDELVRFVSYEVREQVDVELTPEEAAQFVFLTNNRVCPDLAR